jgi:hypothetical protein
MAHGRRHARYSTGSDSGAACVWPHHATCPSLPPPVPTWQNSTLAPVYDALLQGLTDLLINDAVESFVGAQEAGAIPAELVDEMRGIADGCRAVNVLTPVTFERIVTLNFGFDYLLSLIYSGQILQLLVEKATARGDAAVVATMAGLPRSVFRSPAYCNAFAATGAAAGGGSVMGRDFMFALAGEACIRGCGCGCGWRPPSCFALAGEARRRAVGVEGGGGGG